MCWRSGVLGIPGDVELSSGVCHGWVVLFLFCGLIVAIWFVVCGRLVDGGGPRDDVLVGGYAMHMWCGGSGISEVFVVLNVG